MPDGSDHATLFSARFDSNCFSAKLIMFNASFAFLATKPQRASSACGAFDWHSVTNALNTKVNVMAEMTTIDELGISIPTEDYKKIAIKLIRLKIKDKLLGLSI